MLGRLPQSVGFVGLLSGPAGRDALKRVRARTDARGPHGRARGREPLCFAALDGVRPRAIGSSPRIARRLRHPTIERRPATTRRTASVRRERLALYHRNGFSCFVSSCWEPARFQSYQDVIPSEEGDEFITSGIREFGCIDGLRRFARSFKPRGACGGILCGPLGHLSLPSHEASVAQRRHDPARPGRTTAIIPSSSTILVRF